MFGTALWLCHAGQRANHWSMYRAAVKVFSGLFHINGNSFYSIINVYNEYVLSMLKTHNFELYEHFQARLFTNMTGVPYCSQSHDARHEEANKKAQNMFLGNSLDKLAFGVWCFGLFSWSVCCSKFGISGKPHK